MAWSRDEHPVISDQWRVSSLIRAVVDLFFSLCVLLCTIISITTTKLIKASGLFPSCPSCEALRPGRTQGVLKRYHKLELCDRQRDHRPSTWSCDNHRDQAAMSVICEDCSLSRSQCSCVLERAPVVGKRSSAGIRSNAVSGSNIVNDSYGHTYWSNERTGSHKYGCCSLGSSCDWSEKVGIGNRSLFYGSGCRGCDGPGFGVSPSSGRAVKRKFAKVFPTDTRDLCSDPANVVEDSVFLIPRKEPAEVLDVAVKQKSDCSLNTFQEGRYGAAYENFAAKHALSDSDYRRQLSQEESPRDSSQESFSYNRRSSLNYLMISEDSGDARRIGKNLSIDSDLLGGETTPDSNGSFASPSHGMGEEDDNSKIGVMELKEALRAEQEALDALYVELEEERNASSSAANEAMAMIARLQEEKAAILMEARQYQRMAEEKQSYDQEAIAMLQEILLRRDEEMYALEEEVNLYRERLLTLKMDEWVKQNDTARLGRPIRGDDVFLIERETLLLEGNEDWKNRRDSHEEELLAEIKDWLCAAHEKVVPETVEDACSPEDLQSGTSEWSLPNGRTNLLESFSSVAVESQDKEVGNGDATVSQDTAAGLESFQGMMNSLRQEPSLRDEESLKTLKKIEEKFNRQSSNCAARNGDELRQIWKNILRSFESDESENVESQSKLNSRAQGSVVSIATGGSTDQPDQAVVGAAGGNRATEEKRLSVLEYVWKFEEQVHQLEKKKPFQLAKLGSSTIESVSEDPPEHKGAYPEFHGSDSDSDRPRKSFPIDDRPNPMKPRFRKLATDGSRAASLNAEGDLFTVRGEAAPSSRLATTSTQQPIFVRQPVSEEGNYNEGCLVHDIYEVEHDTQEVSSYDGSREIECSSDLRKFVSCTVNELLREEFVDNHETAHCVQDFINEDGNRLGKPDFIPGYTLLEVSANGKGRPPQTISRNFTTCMAENGICEQDDESQGDCGSKQDILQSADGGIFQWPLSVRPDATTEDVMQHLTLKLKALEADRQMMQNTISSLRIEKGEIKVLEEIAQQLRELRGMEQTTGSSAEDTKFVSSIKGILSFNGLRQSVQSQLNKLVHIFRGSGEPGACPGGQQVGLYRLLHRSPLSNQAKPIEQARSLKAADVVSSSDQLLQLSSTLNTLLPQHSWPKDARERSGTAFSGWDY